MTNTTVTANSGSGGASFAVDTISGTTYPISKIAVGVSNSAVDVSATNPLPVGPGSTSVFPVSDNGGSITVDGTVTAMAGLNLNTSALALESGGNLAGAATSLAVIDDWDESDRCKVNPIAGQAGVAAGSGAVSALTQRVVLATDVALPAGTNAIGKLAANSGVDIGDVDVTSVVPGTGATSLGKAEDAAHASGDTGVMALAVRRDANTTLVGADGDYAPFQVDASGSLKVAIVSGAGSGGTSATDDAAFSPASGSGTPIMGFADETAPDSVDEGDVGVVRMTLTRALHVNLRDSSGTELSVGGGTQYDEDSVHVSGDKVTMAGVVRQDTATALSGTDGDRTCLITDSTGRLHVNVGNTVTVASHAVTNAGTFAVQSTVAASATNIAKAEDAASADADVGVPAMAVRKATPANTSGTDGDYEMLQMSAGRLWTSSTIDAALPAGTNAIGALTANQTVDLNKVAGNTTSTGNGVAGTGCQRVTIASDNTAFTTNAAQSGTWTVQPGNTANTTAWKVDASSVAVPVTDNSGSITVDAPVGTPVFATATPSTTGGWSKVKYAAQTTTVQTPKGTAANFGGYFVYNPNTSVAYLQVFDAATATSITLGTTAPDMIFGIPPTSAANLEISNGVNMANGIKLACTTTATGLTAPSTGLDMTILYK